MTAPTIAVYIDGTRLNDGSDPPPAAPPPTVVVGAPTRTNRALNPGYEVGNSCYLSNNGASYPVTADTAAPIAGTRSAITIRTTSSPGITVTSVYFAETGSVKTPVTAGQQLTVALSVKTDVDDASVQTRFYWYDAGGTLLPDGVFIGRVPVTVAGQVYRVVSTDTAPATAASGRVALIVNRNGGVFIVGGERVWMDELVIEYGDTGGSYFDGDTPDTADLQYDWTGTPNASTSTVSPLTYVQHPAPEDLRPVALSGLSVTWGRATTVDQPEPSTASFDVMDPAGGASFLGLLYVGAAVDIRSAAEVDAPDTLPINADTSFELVTPGTVPATWEPKSGTVAAATTAQAYRGAQSIRMTRGPLSSTADVAIRPAPRSTDPSAWDHLPPMRTGERWAVDAAVLAPAGVKVYITPTGFTGPNADSTGLQGRVTGYSDGGWMFMEARLTVQEAIAGWWLGEQLTFHFLNWESSTGSWADQVGSWVDQETAYVDDVAILAPASAGTVRRDVVVFSGRITDVDAGWDDGVGGVVCRVVAADFTADLANRVVGDVPWPVQSVTDRTAAILAAAGSDVPISIAPTLAPALMSWLDVDAQPALPLLQDVATSVDGVLWSAVHLDTGPYLYLADPAVLSALYTLQLGDAGLVEVVPLMAADNVIALDACELLRDPVVFRQAASDVSTRVVVSWQDQTVDDQGNPAPTERSVTLIDPVDEQALGVRRVAVSTLLTTDVAATGVAERILGRLRRQSWRASGLVLESAWADPSQVGAVMDLLDGTRRLAAPILLSNLPDWAPTGGTIPLYLQGGRYQYTDGAWTLDLVTASAQSQGTSLPWADLDPAWNWTEFDPAVAWSDLIGVTT